uniref:Uncharacterized protein n=1 Tax=Kwoniella bestiolae CBS 10118 TaxID=1296100 RepID=A0A1B9FUV9_9TREE|nr:hypothetical protein I302_08198 [Kwoniella bestiolae CBS 10118]OCF22548.1 hypothetical protein I302_08198 [Kwoniella bestiolae CBS 10118]
MSSFKHISPKSSIDSYDTTFDPYPYPARSAHPSSSTLRHTSPPSYEIEKQPSGSSSQSRSRRSSSSSSSTSDKSLTSQSSIEELLPTHTHSHGSNHLKERKTSSTSTTSTIFGESSAIRILKTLKPRARRRSSLPFIHLARRKSTQLLLTLGIFVVAALLISEVRSHKVRRELWNREIRFEEWDIRYNDRESNLAKFREDYEYNKRLEVLQSRRLNKRDQQSVWGPREEEALQTEARGKWPSWWGNPDVVGRSPWDHQPVPLGEGEKRRFLFLTDYKDYLERMNTHTYEIVDAALRHPQLSVDVWGPGWEGYDRSIPLSANIRKRAHRLAQLESSRRKFEEEQNVKKQEMVEESEEEEQWVKPGWYDEIPDGCNADVGFDIVFTISNIYKEDDPHVDALDCGALLIQQLGDCHELRCSYEWYPHANNITVSKYAFELLELFEYDKVKAKYPDWQMGMFGHSPDTGNEWDFYPIPWNEKTAKAKVFGYDGSFYPIRTTVTDFLRAIEREPNLLQESIITRHPHPGYTVSVPSSAREQPLETYELGHEYYQTHLKLREDFANGMRTSKICVFDASLERKMIRKYAQAFLSGCVVASDLPTEHEESLSKFVIPLKSTWNIEKINEVLNHYLENDELLQQMAMDGFIWARQHMTTSNKVTHLLKMGDHYRAGSRGYEFPYGFSMRCRSYWSGDAYRPPWCAQGGYRGLEE